MPTALKTSLGRALGSAAARRLLTQDEIPAVVYGHGMTPTPVTVDRKALRVALSGPAGLNTVLDLQVGNDTYPAIVKEVQRDPVKRNVSHVDFMQIDLSKEIVMSVPIHLTGTAKAVVQEGGLVDPAVDRIEIRAAANNIPNEIVIDVTDMNMNTIIRMEDITLPAGVAAVSDPDLVVVTVLVTSTQVDKPVAVAGEAEAGEAPAAGAPAAGDKPAAS